MHSIRPLLMAAVAGGALSSAGFHLLLATPFEAMQPVTSAPSAQELSAQQIAVYSDGRSKHSARSQQLNAVASITPALGDHSTQAARQSSEALAIEALELGHSLEKQIQRLTEIVQQSSADGDSRNQFSAESIDDLAELDTARQLDAIESTFFQEPIDTDWDFETQDVIENSFTRETLTNATLISAECKSSMCRAVVEHIDADSVASFELDFPLAVSEHLPSLVMEQQELDNGGYRTTVFMARAGFGLPTSEPDI